MTTKHPMNKKPLRLRMFFNNFMGTKSGNNYEDGLNWDMDVVSYRFQLPRFEICKKWFDKYGLASEEKDNKSGT